MTKAPTTNPKTKKKFTRLTHLPLQAQDGRQGKVYKSWFNVKISAINTLKRLRVRSPKNPHHTLRLTRPKRYRFSAQELKTTWQLLVDAWHFITLHPRVMLGMGLLYAILSYVLVGGISQLDYVAFKDASQDVINGNLGAVGTALSLFGAAVTGNLAAPPSEIQQFISGVLLLFFWLAVVWATRMLSAGKTISLRDALYNSGGPFIPTLVIFAVMAVQLLPGALGVFAYSVAVNGGWLTGGVEAMVFAAAAALLGLISLYFLVSSVVGLIIVTLPSTYPWRALQSAKELVMNKRWGLVVRVVSMVVSLLVLWGVVLVPVFLLDNWLRLDALPLVPIFVQALAGFSLVFSSVYVYKLYRSLL